MTMTTIEVSNFVGICGTGRVFRTDYRRYYPVAEVQKAIAGNIRRNRLRNRRMVCPESCRLLAGESPVAVRVRPPRSRQPVLLPKEPPRPQGGLCQPPPRLVMFL
jgi:hypothetical protein